MVKKKTMAEPKEAKSKAQQAKALKEKYDALITEAKDELLATVNGAIAELSELGYAYTLVLTAELDALKNAPVASYKPQGRPKKAGTASATSSAPKAAPGPSANYDEAKTCNFCGGKKGHDGRAHRSQEPKRPFTPQELTERGLLPPEANA